MFNSTVLETAIGLIFVYLIFSLIASAIAEYFSALLDRRSDHLKHILFNLFDNDDPQGRAFLNLFVSHPMIQSLNSTTWEPKFQCAQDRHDDQKEQFEQSRTIWKAAAKAVSDIDAARDAAKSAVEAAATAVAAAADLKKALKAFGPNDAASVSALQTAVARAKAAAEAAERASLAADDATLNASAAGNDLRLTRSDPTNAPSAAPTRPIPRVAAPTPTREPAPPPDTISTPAPPAQSPGPPPATPPAGDPRANAQAAIERAETAAGEAKKAAASASQAADAATKLKKGLDSEFIKLANVPKYIPDRAFANVLMHVLTAESTLKALSRGDDDGPRTTTSRSTTTFWDRFGSALKVVAGVASRLPDNAVKTRIQERIASIEQALSRAGDASADASAIVAQLESGTNELRAATAAVPDDALRSALEKEIETSLRPLHILGQDILSLERATATIALMADSSIKTALSAFLDQAGEDLESFKRSIGSWFNDVMDHASGWYKRNTQRILVLIALILCTLNNVDTVSLVGRLSSDPQIRAEIAKQAREFEKAHEAAGKGEGQVKDEDPQKVIARYQEALAETTLPLWWSRKEWRELWYQVQAPDPTIATQVRNAGPTPRPAPQSSWEPRFAFAPNYTGLLAKLTGLLISILAVSMGAPFWFDLLNKVVNIRLVGKRPEPTITDAPPAPPPAAAPKAGATGARSPS